jgi:hypothetical protein
VTDCLGNCWHCGRALGQFDLGRESLCLGCNKPTRVCRNCRWFAPGRPYDCRENVAEPVMDKMQANFCDAFEAIPRTVDNQSAAAVDHLSAAEALFKRE